MICILAHQKMERSLMAKTPEMTSSCDWIGPKGMMNSGSEKPTSNVMLSTRGNFRCEKMQYFCIGYTSLSFTYWLTVVVGNIWGFAKLKQFQKSKKTIWIELTPPTHSPSKLFFGNPSLTWTEHSNNNNNQQLLAMHMQTEYTWYTSTSYVPLL